MRQQDPLLTWPLFCPTDWVHLIDRNGVAVLLEERMLGYLPRQMARVLAPDMDSELRLTATIMSTAPGGIPRSIAKWNCLPAAEGSLYLAFVHAKG